MAPRARSSRHSVSGIAEVLRKRPNIALWWLHTCRPKDTATTRSKLRFVNREMRQIGFVSLRAPKAPLTPAAQAEVEHLLRRLARHDPRARL